MANVERWTITPARRIGKPGDYGLALGTVDPRPPVDGEPFEVVRAADYEGAVEALDEAIKAARLFNRNGMTWLEYDRKLVELEQFVNHARGR